MQDFPRNALDERVGELFVRNFLVAAVQNLPLFEVRYQSLYKP